MKKIALLIPFLLPGCTLLGPTYTGETTANWLLKTDTEYNISIIFQAIHDCSPKEIHTKINEIKLKESTEIVDLADETWIVKGCGHTDVFNVKYINDGQGGTYINMKKLTN